MFFPMTHSMLRNRLSVAKLGRQPSGFLELNPQSAYYTPDLKRLPFMTNLVCIRKAGLFKCLCALAVRHDHTKIGLQLFPNYDHRIEVATTISGMVCRIRTKVGKCHARAAKVRDYIRDSTIHSPCFSRSRSTVNDEANHRSQSNAKLRHQ